MLLRFKICVINWGVYVRSSLLTEASIEQDSVQFCIIFFKLVSTVTPPLPIVVIDILRQVCLTQLNLAFSLYLGQFTDEEKS